MPASLPGESAANNAVNPSAGRPIIMDPLSGPKGSPLDVVATRGNPGVASTGALSTGIGFGANYINAPVGGLSSGQALFNAGFNDNQQPGGKVLTYAAAPPPGVVATQGQSGAMLYIGGGRSSANVTSPDKFSVPFVANPYTAGVALAMAGNGVARDAGAGPAFTGTPMKLVTATGAVAPGAVVETGFLNRSGVALVSGQSVFASDNTALAAAA